jgi:tRNA-dihydrouridine synthase
MLARHAILNPWIFRDFQNSGSKISDKLVMPSVNDINLAKEDYNKWVQRTQTKKKFVDFHRCNFERLEKGLKNTLLDIPRTRHFS